MSKKINNIIWGIVFVAAGVVLALNVFNIMDINIFFDGWWALFIIVPCLFGIFTSSDKTGNIIGVIFGVLLLLAAQEVFEFEIIWKLIIPFIIIRIGIKIMFKNFGQKNSEQIEDGANRGLYKNHTAVFSGQEIAVDEEFFGANLTAVFGGIDYNLSRAQITNSVTINSVSIFGGTDIFLPKNVNVKVTSTSIFGGVDNMFLGDNNPQNPTVYINAVCIFGGTDIK